MLLAPLGGAINVDHDRNKTSLSILKVYDKRVFLFQQYLDEDIPKSVRPWVEELLSAYRVLIYNGQLDVIVAYPLTEGYLQKLNWKDKDVYANAKRSIWRVSGKVAGYVKIAGNLMDVMVRDAGHMVPKDQPEFAYQLIRNFTTNLPLA